MAAPTRVTCHETGSDHQNWKPLKVHADANKQNKQQKVLHFKHKVFSNLSWQLKLFQLLPLAHLFKLLQHELEGVLGLVVGNACHDVLHRTSRSTHRSRLRICQLIFLSALTTGLNLLWGRGGCGLLKHSSLPR